MKVCVIGAGLMGLSVARKVARDGNEVTVVERDEQVGGLATYHDFGGFYWDRYYHVILPSDQSLIKFVTDLGLADSLEWRRTRTGFFVDDHLYSISSNIEFLRFPLLSIMSKLRLAWTMLYGSRINNWQRLEKIPVESWLRRVSGDSTFEKLWRPLLLAKLGQNYERVSAVFIWSYIKRLFSARDTSASAEHLGHVKGGYKMIFDRLLEQIEGANGTVICNAEVSHVGSASCGGIEVSINGSPERFDKVICTSPVSVLRKIIDESILDVSRDGEGVEYLGVICAVIVSNKPLVPFYVVNIADEDIPFTGIIGMSTVVDSKNTGGKYLTYLPRYILSSDPALKEPDESIEASVIIGLEKLLPDFDADCIERIHVNRAFKVQPLQVLDYSRKVPRVTTNHPDLFVLNTAQFVNATLNNNEVIATVDKFYRQFGSEFQGAGSRG